jgi:hypothetical protein
MAAWLILLLLSLSRPLAVSSSCTPIIETERLKGTATVILLILESLNEEAVEKYAQIPNIPFVKALTARSSDFATKFPGYTLDPELFRLSRDLGLQYILMNVKYRTDDDGVNEMAKQCAWLGGSLFQPDNLHVLSGLQELMNSYGDVKFTDVVLPVYKTSDDKVKYHPSKKNAEWVVNVGKVPLDKINTETKFGLIAKVQEPKFAPDLRPQFGNISLCAFETGPSVSRIPSYASILKEKVKIMKKPFNKLDEFRQLLISYPKQLNPCKKLKTVFPQNIQTEIDYLYNNANSHFYDLYAIKSDGDLDELLRHIDRVHVAITELNDVYSEILAQYNDPMTPANQGNWDELDFDVREAEEQLILVFCSLLVVSIIIHAYLALTCCRSWRLRRQRIKILSKYPNLEEMPMVYRARLAK